MNKEEKPAHNPQKFNWRQVKILNSFAEADALRNKLRKDGEKHVKVRRCGVDGKKFKVKVGTNIKKKKE